MDLATCCNNPRFFNHAKKLIASFLKLYPKSKVIVGVFGETERLAGRVSPQLEFYPVPQDCDHAWNPRFYYFKNATMKYAAETCKESFIWLDSANLVVDKMVEVEQSLESKSRFFDQYPHTDFYKIKEWTTKTCIERLGATIESVGDMYGYQSLIQAYAITKDNKEFINKMWKYMKDPLIAGPSNHCVNPDGETGIAKTHRNDLSVLSIMIPICKFDQPYDYEISRRYGDRATYDRFGGSERYEWKPRILTRSE